MPSNTLAPKAGLTRSTNERPSVAAALKDGMIRFHCLKGLKINDSKITVPTHDKLKAYVDTKPKNDLWSPFTIQNAAANTFSRERK